VIRIFQLCGPALLAACQAFWPPDNIASTTIGMISILSHLIPPAARLSVQMYVGIVGMVLNGLDMIGCSLAAKYFKKTARLPKALPAVITSILRRSPKFFIRSASP
jgi:hypothetical protein